MKAVCKALVFDGNCLYLQHMPLHCVDQLDLLYQLNLLYQLFSKPGNTEEAIDELRNRPWMRIRIKEHIFWVVRAGVSTHYTPRKDLEENLESSTWDMIP